MNSNCIDCINRHVYYGCQKNRSEYHIPWTDCPEKSVAVAAVSDRITTIEASPHAIIPMDARCCGNCEYFTWDDEYTEYSLPTMCGLAGKEGIHPSGVCKDWCYDERNHEIRKSYDPEEGGS